MKFYTYIFFVFAIWPGNTDFADRYIQCDDRDNSRQDFSEGKAGRIADEYLDWRSMRIYGELPLLTSKDSLIYFVGLADSIVAPDDVCVSFYDEPFEYGYFKGIEVEIYGDTAVITSLNFRENHELFVKSAMMTLSHRISLTDLEALFPNAVKAKREIDIYGLGPAMAVTLMTAKNPTDDAWLLFFSEGKLIRMDYWMPC